MFYYRYQCLKLAADNTISLDADFNRVIAKKTLWAFYAGLRFETSLVNRFKDFIKYYRRLQYVYSSPQMSVLDSIKSQFYILKTIVFR